MLISHPVGNQNVRALVSYASQIGVLTSFHTSISTNILIDSPFISDFFKKKLMLRYFEGVDKKNIFTYPFFDVSRLLLKKLNFKKFVDEKTGILRPDNLYKSFDQNVANYIKKEKSIPAVYGYDSKSMRTFTAAKELGANCFYEAAFGCNLFVNDILEEEYQNNPSWRSLIPNFQSAYKNISQATEIELSDKIIVASSFAQDCFKKYYPSKKTFISNYGFPKKIRKKENFNSKVKVLYVGSLNQQKGISYFFESMKYMDPKAYHFTVVGSDISNGECVLLNNCLLNVEYHKWLPHLKILDLMHDSDVLVLPSLADASGLVVQEAMAQGIPVIVTENVGAKDFVVNKENGFIVPIRSGEVISACLELLNDKDYRYYLSTNAMNTALTRSWEDFAHDVLDNLGF